MGLDMYLIARQNVGFREEDPLKTRLADAGLMPYRNMVCLGIDYEAMYWRKANAVHQFFVDHCQGGVDDCRRAYVGEVVLNDLIHRCKAILAEQDPQERDSLAMELLPPQAGFFFGTTALSDDYYFALKRTYQELEKVLEKTSAARSEHWEFYYQSSW